MTSSSSRRVGVVQGSQRAATGPEPSSGVGPAFHLDEPEPPLRSYLELGALPTAVPCARLHARHVLCEWGVRRKLHLMRIGACVRAGRLAGAEVPGDLAVPRWGCVR
jgi:hypothetical protein